MAKKVRTGKNTHRTSGLWIAPTSSLNQRLRESAWKLPQVEPSESSRILELADIALGLKAPQRKRDEYKMKRGA
jgi:hypothetical protein